MPASVTLTLTADELAWLQRLAGAWGYEPAHRKDDVWNLENDVRRKLRTASFQLARAAHRWTCRDPALAVCMTCRLQPGTSDGMAAADLEGCQWGRWPS